ncbi:MAG: ECF transporter S component [Chloroflexi bacterium]|nr:MAG: ECF transporter S component [Chloroflexota bacterium]TMF97621.1 MAG: ECF transporter S component [Chloroflexota bacterium]
MTASSTKDQEGMTLGVLNAFRFRLNTLAIVLIPVCIAIDWAGHALASTLKLPLFLDSIGTVLGGLLAGPWVGGLAGLITNFISSGTVDPIAAPYSIISLAIGIAAGIGGYYGWHKTWPGRIALYILIVLVASIGSTPLNVNLYGGQSGVAFGDTVVYAPLVKAGWPTWLAAYLDELSGDLPDKLITVVVAVLIYFGLPNRYRALFSVWRRPSGEPEPAPAS